MRNFTSVLYLKLLILCCIGCSATQAADEVREPLVLAVHPYLSFQELQQRFKPLALYLEAILGREVVVRIGPDYSEHLRFIGNDKVDIAYLGPAIYVRMVEKYGPKPLLARLEVHGSPMFHGFLVTRAASRITDIQSLRGKRFAFGDPASTMSHLVPRYMMMKAGIEVRDLADYQFLHGHRNVALAVLAGAYDAGAVKQEVMEAYEDRGLRAIAKSEAVSEHLFVARSDAPVVFVDDIREALYRLSDSARGRAILQGLKEGATDLVPVQDKDYDNLRVILAELREHGVE